MCTEPYCDLNDTGIKVDDTIIVDGCLRKLMSRKANSNCVNKFDISPKPSVECHMYTKQFLNSYIARRKTNTAELIMPLHVT